ncbi:hypothetical protein FB451DRAFT_1263459 [Mycena latifolia]|nr:hypothetical protein FB451DRAFT_1263459 [Mycena latifolia]
MSAIPAFAMSLLCIVGGGTAYFKKSSIPSLIAGVSVGLLYLWSGSLLADGHAQGLQAAFYASALLTVTSLPRIAKGPVPKLLATSSAVVGFYYGRKIYA